MKAKRFLALLLCLAMMLSLLAGCNTNSEDPKETNSGTTESDSEDPNKKPLEGEKLSIWIPIMWAGKTMDYAENEAFKQIQENLGVELEFITPAAGSEVEQFNIMMTSGEMPDIIFTGWSGFNGLFTDGADAYIEEGLIYELSDLVDQYAPNYKKIITEVMPEVERNSVYTDAGNMYQFGCISPYEEYAWNGLLIRDDFLEAVGMDSPETIEEYEAVLTAFKEQLGCEAPLLMGAVDGTSGYLMSAWNLAPGIYQENNVVKWGFNQPDFKEYLALMNRWYENGLLYVDFAVMDTETQQRLMTTGESGMILGSPATVNSWMTGIGTVSVGAYPTLEAGQRINFRMVNRRLATGFGAVITTNCKNVEAAVKFLDYGYSEEGYMLYNYGIEGLTYNRTGNTLTFDGFEYPEAEFTDVMKNNPEYPVMDAILEYKLHAGPFLRFEHQSNPTLDAYTLSVLREITEGADPVLNMPPVTYTSDENATINEIMTQINTYANTSILEFIMGIRSLDEFDSYLAEIEEMGIQDVIDICQDALDRYNNR